MMRIPDKVLIAFGLVMLLYSGLGVLKAFRKQRLLPKGFFAVFPNPMYAAYILAIVPGLALVPAEDNWLKERFRGSEVSSYSLQERDRRHVAHRLEPRPAGEDGPDGVQRECARGHVTVHPTLEAEVEWRLARDLDPVVRFWLADNGAEEQGDR